MVSFSLASSPEICGHARYGSFKIMSVMKIMHKVANIFHRLTTIVAVVCTLHSGALLASEAL